MRTAGGRIGATLTGAADTIAWRKGDEASEISNAKINLTAAAPVSLSDAHVEARASAADAQVAGNGFAGASVEAQMDAGVIGAGFVPKTWSGTLRAALAAAKGANIDAGSISADATLHGENSRLTGDYVAKLGAAARLGFRRRTPFWTAPSPGIFRARRSRSPRRAISRRRLLPSMQRRARRCWPRRPGLAARRWGR
ncbi:MAG: hypothetical protein WDN76_01005 [Alphaproteobacteria bacterium]